MKPDGRVLGDSHGSACHVRVGGMRTGVIVKVFPADRERLAAIAVDRDSPRKPAWRTRIVPLTGARAFSIT